VRNFIALRRAIGVAFAIFGFSLTAQAADLVQARQRGWEDMCMRGDQPMNFCTSYGGPKQLAHSQALEGQLHAVSNEINARYRFQSDKNAYGVSDYWTVPRGGVADCEDYVLAKIMALHTEGVPVSAMTILIGQLSNGAWHAVLGVKTDQGMIKLDSLNGLGKGFRTAYYLDMSNTSSWRIAG
jgi:predicted transglutaminase-like cysteine proteinase